MTSKGEQNTGAISATGGLPEGPGGTGGVDATGGTAGITGGADTGTSGASGGTGEWVAGAGGVLEGAGGEGGAIDDGLVGPACEEPACCVPLRVNGQRSQVFLVRDQITFDVIAQVMGSDPIGESWNFDIEVESDATGPVSCEGTYATNVDRSLFYNSCSAAPLGSPACGEVVEFSVRLLSSKKHRRSGSVPCPETTPSRD